MEEEVREILKASLTTDPSSELNLAEAIRRRFAPFNGVELAIPRRKTILEPPSFES